MSNLDWQEVADRIRATQPPPSMHQAPDQFVQSQTAHLIADAISATARAAEDN